MKEILELPDELLTYVKERANDLANTVLILFEYILVPRYNYLEVTPVMNPKINDKMVSYTIQNILGVIVNSDTKYTISDTVFRIPEVNSEYSINDLFIVNMGERLKNTMSFLNPDNSAIITPQGMSVFKNYIEHVLNEALLVLSDGDLDMDIKDILTNHKNIKEYIIENTNTEGDNVIFPKNYNFNDDDDNIIVQSFVWLMCGLNDWLEKDYIEEDDVKYMSKIMFGGMSIDMLNGEINEDIKMNIKEALFLSDFFTSDKAANLMSKLFSNIKENYNNEIFSKRVKQFSIVI